MGKILVVDDAREIRELLAATLVMQQHQIVHAGSGAEAVAKAVPDGYTLLFTVDSFFIDSNSFNLYKFQS